MQAEVVEAFRAIDVPEGKALRAASALSRRDGDVTSLKSDVAIIQWMLGFVPAFEIATVLKLFLHA